MVWTLRTNDLKRELLVADILVCQKKYKINLGLKKLALFWGLAIVSIFIPVLHFVLVPAFLITGVVSFFNQFKHTHLINKGEYVCPSCKRDFQIKNIYFSDGHRLNCELCQTQLVIEETT